MNVMPFATAVLAAATFFAVSACGAQSRDGVLCGENERPVAGPVFIEIGLDGDTPSAKPKLCNVLPNAQVSWISTARPFVLSFKTSNPGGSKLPRNPASSPSNGKQMIRVNAAAPLGQYDYGITIDGKTVDPAIIIKKAQQ